MFLVLIQFLWLTLFSRVHVNQSDVICFRRERERFDYALVVFKDVQKWKLLYKHVQSMSASTVDAELVHREVFSFSW